MLNETKEEYNLRAWAYRYLIESQELSNKFLTKKGQAIMLLVINKEFQSITHLAKELHCEVYHAWKLAKALASDNLISLTKYKNRVKINFSNEMLETAKEYVEKMEEI